MKLAINATDDVNRFLLSMELHQTNLLELVTTDIELINDAVINAILCRKMVLDNNWTSYILSDIDVYYYDSMIDFVSRLELFNIRDVTPPIRSRNNGLAIMYRFTMSDIFGREMDTVTGFRVSIQRETGKVDNRWVIVYG